jgi:hypothetical protein
LLQHHIPVSKRMECKFIRHGITISYDQVTKPCCIWRSDSAWKVQNHITKIDLSTWHKSSQIIDNQTLLEKNQWPTACGPCKNIEAQGREDSMRGNGNHSYADYKDDDITLEIRPGSVCNFACQTCWPEASSRVAQYHHQANIIDIKSVNSTSIDNFDFLKPISHRIRDVILLGGEPFYDKSCKKFIIWARENLSANLMMFTNGSEIDFDFLTQYPGKLTLIFSLDAMGRAAEYVRYGTDWDRVLKNYQQVRNLKNVEVRVNITCSVYNYTYLEQLIEFLCQDWPDIVTFGAPLALHFLESVVPLESRPELIESLQRAVNCIDQANIESGQKSNAINAINANIHNLQNGEWSKDNHTTLCDFIERMDRVKNISLQDYCPEIYNILQH